MSVRSLNGLAGNTNIYVNSVSAREPLELLTPNNTSSTMTIKGLSDFGSANQIVKVNSTADALTYVDDFGGTAPIVITGSTISYDISGLGDATLALTDNVFVQQGVNLKKTNFTNIKTLLGVADLTTSNNFGTSATGVIKLGNSQGTAQTASLEFYGTSFKLKNTSNVNVATFTPVSNTCNLDLNGGLLTKFTASTNAVWNGGTIGTIYGGTGLTTYTKGQILYASGTNTLAKLNIGSADQFLIVGSTGIPTWSNIPVSIYTTITEVPNTNLFLMVDSSNAYKKVSVNNFVQLYQDTINYGGLAPIVKDTSNDLYKFDLFNLTNITSIGNSATFFISSTGFNEQYRKITFANLQSSLVSNGILTDGVNFGTDTTNTANRVFGNSTRNSVINGAVLSLQSAGTTRISVSGDIITMARGSTDMRVAHSTDTNNFSNASTTSHISSVNDLHLFSPGQEFSGSLNRYVCLAGTSQAETAIFGFAGSGITLNSGGIPNPGNSNATRNSTFVMTTGTDNAFSICNRSGNAFSTTTTQFSIRNDDTDFWTENVIVNGNVGEAVLKLNSGGGAIVGQSGRSYIGRDTNTGYIYLGNATDSSELFSTITYAKTIDLSVGLDSTGDFSIKSAGERRIKITGSGSRHTLVGRRADSTATADTALHICNNSLSSSSTDARLRIESRTSTYDPVIEFCANTGNDATQVISFVYGNNSGNVIITSNSPTTKYFIVFTRVITNSFNYFVNQNSFTGFQVWTSASSISSTGSFFWRQWINGEGASNNGNYLFQYSTFNGSYGARAFISSGTSSYIQMNFTGQHRCVPEEEELYDNVDNYIGMVVESTGLYNSMDFEEYEEVVEGESVVDEYTDPETGEKYPETRTLTSHIVKKTRIVYTTEPTINDCEPIVKLTTTYKSKKVFGVISNKEDVDGNGDRSFLVGNFGSTLGEKTDNRLYINSVGEGGILVNNQNGNIENGDLLCSSSTTGIACKQEDDIVRNYTIGKATMDYNFTGNENKLIGCVYYCG